VVKPDYAKWMLDDPRVNFAISTRGRPAGLDHLGIQVEDRTELHEVYDRLGCAGDPAGISWETFLTTGESTVYGDGSGERAGEAKLARGAKPGSAGACCAPAVQEEKSSACCAR
jgi:hypothetical protein